MRRATFRWTLILVSTSALVALLAQVVTTVHERKESDLELAGLGSMPEQVVQWIQDFRRIEVRDGEKAFEIEAEEARFLDNRNQILVRKPTTSVFTEQGEKVTVVGGEGVLILEAGELQEVLLRGGVEVRLRDMTLFAEEAVFHQGEQTIVASGPVRVVGDRFELEGTNMVVYVQTNRVEFLADVRARLNGESRPEDLPT